MTDMMFTFFHSLWHKAAITDEPNVWKWPNDQTKCLEMTLLDVWYKTDEDYWALPHHTRLYVLTSTAKAVHANAPAGSSFNLARFLFWHFFSRLIAVTWEKYTHWHWRRRHMIWVYEEQFLWDDHRPKHRIALFESRIGSFFRAAKGKKG